MRTAISVPCPLPVLAREPYNKTVTELTSAKPASCLMVSTQRNAALHGPSVCELEGPTPILNISKTEIDSCGIAAYSIYKFTPFRTTLRNLCALCGSAVKKNSYHRRERRGYAENQIISPKLTCVWIVFPNFPTPKQKEIQF